MTNNFKIIYCIFLLIFMLFNQVETSKKKYYISYKTIEVIKKDLPSHKDLLIYLTVLKRIINYCNRVREVLTYNLVYGLFLINVNLEPFVKNDVLPVSVRVGLNQLLTQSAELQYHYSYEVQRKENDFDNMPKKLAILCANATAWSSRLAESKLNLELLNRPYSYVAYPKWSRYQIAVEDVDNGSPNPKISNQCVKSLADIEENRSIYPMKCHILKRCSKTIVSGTDFGYSLTHRLIMLQLARFSRRCTIFSIQEDEQLRISFCEKAYLEAKYNALNGFKIVDLVLEQIALCTLDGHAQFLRRSWLTNFLEYQNAAGCFQLSKTTHECNDHVMGVASGTYAAAVRFILENY